MMRQINCLMIFAACAVLGLAGCVSASSKEARFVCDGTIEAVNLQSQIASIVQAHKFLPEPVEQVKDGNLYFRGHLEVARPKRETYLYIKIAESNPTKISLMVVQGRSPGSEKVLPSEVLNVFDSIVNEVINRFGKNCVLQTD